MLDIGLSDHFGAEEMGYVGRSPQVDRAPVQVLGELSLHTSKGKVSRRMTRLEFDEQVDIAIWTILSPEDRAEQGQTKDVIPVTESPQDLRFDAEPGTSSALSWCIHEPLPASDLVMLQPGASWSHAESFHHRSDRHYVVRRRRERHYRPIRLRAMVIRRWGRRKSDNRAIVLVKRRPWQHMTIVSGFQMRSTALRATSLPVGGDYEWDYGC